MKRNPEDLKKLFVLRSRNGWTWKELARNSRVPLSTLLVCHRRLRNTAPEEKQPRFAEIEVVDREAPATGIEIVLKNGTRILVRPDFDPEHLRRVVAALDRAC
jgi:hypothetical protein